MFEWLTNRKKLAESKEMLAVMRGLREDLAGEVLKARKNSADVRKTLRDTEVARDRAYEMATHSADLERAHREHLRQADNNLQRVEAERDEARQEWTAAAGARDAWQQTAGELQSDRDEWKGKADIAGQAWADGNRTIERYEARIRELEVQITYLQESLVAAQKNDKRGPDGRFVGSGQ